MNSTEYLWYRLFNLEGFGPKSIHYVYAVLKREGLSLDAFFKFDRPEFHARFPELGHNRLKSATFESFKKQNQEKLEEEFRELSDKGIKIIAIDNELYPSRLKAYMGTQAPPLLFVMGDVSLLRARGVALIGSRNASEDGLEMSKFLAGKLGRAGINIVSGYAKGIDTSAHLGSLSNNGTTTIVLSYGILNFVKKVDFRNESWDDKMLVVSQFPPNAGWSASNAMTRNILICALSHAIVIVESGPERDENFKMSGTFNQGRNALKIKLPLFVLDDKLFTKPPLGNRQLIELGGTRLERDKGHKQLVGYLNRNNAWEDVVPPNEQLSLLF